MERIVKPISRIIKLALVLALVLLIAVIALIKTGYLSPIYPFVVLSGSMEPSLKTGSIAFIAPKLFGYTYGDIITYSQGGKTFTTHRIVKVLNQNGQVNYLTKGDANNALDPTPIPKTAVKGAVIYSLPYLGYLVSYVKTPYGFILLVIIPATIIVYEEIRSLKHETVKLVKEKKRGKKYISKAPVRTYQPLAALTLPHPAANITPSVTPHQKPPPREKPRFNAPLPPRRSPLTQRFYMQAGLSRLSLFIPMAAAAALLVSVSGAYFNDVEKSTGNVMGAGTWGPTSTPIPTPSNTPTPTPTSTPPTPTPTPIIANYLVINEVLPNSNCNLGGQKVAQWLELYNGSNNSINIKNYKLNDGTADIDIVTANTNINPGEIILLAKDNSVWTQCFPNYNHVNRINLGSNINLNSGTLILKTNTLVLIDTVRWGNGNPAPPINQSIERKPKGFDTAIAGNQFISTDFIVNPNPSPGTGL